MLKDTNNNSKRKEFVWLKLLCISSVDCEKISIYYVQLNVTNVDTQACILQLSVPHCDFLKSKG